MAFLSKYQKKKGSRLRILCKHTLFSNFRKNVFYINNKKIKFENGDSLWVSPFLKHGFSGDGSIIKISNGECIDYQDIYELNNLFDYKKTIKEFIRII